MALSTTKKILPPAGYLSHLIKPVARNLGILFDSNLCFKQHILSLSNHVFTISEISPIYDRSNILEISKVSFDILKLNDSWSSCERTYNFSSNTFPRLVSLHFSMYPRLEGLRREEKMQVKDLRELGYTPCSHWLDLWALLWLVEAVLTCLWRRRCKLETSRSWRTGRWKLWGWTCLHI